MDTEFTYEKAGVNIAKADEAKQEMAHYLTPADPRVLNRLGAFASLFEATFPRIQNPVLVLKSEEPGSKQLLALQHKRIHGIGYDLINHLINDIIVMGAQPLAVLDTIICGKLEKSVLVQLVKSMAEACNEQGCSLVGGETSEQPGVIPPGTYILCASAIGVVDKSKIIDGSQIQLGDVVLGIASNGLHTNGYSLVRQLIKEKPDILKQKVKDERFLDIVLRPHKCYYKPLKDLFRMPELHGLAHITGGGIAGNLNRILPVGLSASINLRKVHVLPIFQIIRDAGNISDSEMLRTFNMGIGVTLVTPQNVINRIINHLGSMGCHSYIIGEIIEGDQTVELKGEL